MNGRQYALVTGASSGIGECFARRLAARRKDLVLTSRSEDKLKAFCEELSRAHGIRAESVAIDLSGPQATQALMRILGERRIEIDLLVNNAGAGAHGEFWTVPLDRLLEILRLNIEALVELCRLLVPPMIERRAGSIINVSSTASFQSLPYSSAYAATKSFVTSFSMGIAEELRPYGIKVVTLCPGTTRTNFFAAGGYPKIRFRGGLQAPEEVADVGLRQLDRGGGLVLARNIDKVLIFAERFLPRTFVIRSAGALFKK
ncbi:MAG: SDR family NAD(P)-dependent oxidoreductase [Terriglobia bacterium]